MASEIVRYKSDNGQDIQVTEQDVRDLLAASGNQAVQNVTSQEIKTFMRLCQSQRLNPFTRDAYIVKYGNQPASVIAGKDAFVKRATRNKRYRGHEAGITVIGNDGKISRREGSMVLKGETLVGGWTKVYLDGYACPIFEEVALSEYSAPDKYGKNGWSRMPATMIRKVALCHALREAFPEDLGGLYGAEEMDQAQQQAEPQPQEEAEVEIVVDEVEEAEQPPIDPRRELWKTAGDLKQQVLAMGANESGITSWMDANVKDEQGNPKHPKTYTADDVQRLINHLQGQLSGLQTLQQQQADPVYEYDEQAEANGYYANQEYDAAMGLADHDIPF